LETQLRGEHIHLRWLTKRKKRKIGTAFNAIIRAIKTKRRGKPKKEA
jgi:hypothetical protein